LYVTLHDGTSINENIVDGARRIVVEVFDLTYDEDQLTNLILDSADAVRELPVALNLTTKQRGSAGKETDNGGATPGAPDIGEMTEEDGLGAIDLDYFGADLIRTKIFERRALAGDPQRVMRTKPLRVTEEAFFHVLDPANDP
jgi:hypothetical protein